MIAALVELIRHIQTMRRRGGRAARPRTKAVVDVDCEACFIAALWRLDLQEDGAEWLGEVWGELACHLERSKGPREGASKSGERPEWFKPNAFDDFRHQSQGFRNANNEKALH